ncbi:MAG: ATP-binding cassette domain-containing protein, partial [Deltaproteobacteria bacterium]|nr:ATP-binding cassette domain-containing protein [Deltaproteobacteria bacterium]
MVGKFEVRANLPEHPGTTVIIGPNGAGKSTLLKSLLGVVTPVGGRIVLGDRVLFDADEGRDVPTEARRLGYVPQRYALFSHLDVKRNVGYGMQGMARKQRDARARELLDELEIGHLADRRVSALSGGEAQRVALARALAIGPRALLLDEPMAALDAGARRKVRVFLRERLEATSLPTVIVSHDPEDARILADRVAVMDSGRLAQLGSFEEIE